jgi:hypothetical protein
MTYDCIIEAIRYFGHSARRIFTAVEAGIENEKSVVEKAIEQIPSGTDIANLITNLSLPHNTSHTIFEVRSNHPGRIFQMATHHATSGWVLDKLIKEYELRLANAAWEFYTTLRSSDDASLRGRIWERQVHSYLHSRTNSVNLVAISLEIQQKSIDIEIPPGIPRRDFNSGSFLNNLEDAIQKRNPVYLIPLDPNFPTIDSALYKPDNPFCYFQMTIADQHSPKTIGFKKLQRWMKRDSLASTLRPTKHKPWHLIYIVPKGMRDTISKQCLVGSESEVEIWGAKIKQFVLEISTEEVFKK